MSDGRGMDDAELGRWREAMRALAAPVVASDDAGHRFVDEMGHRRPVDGVFLAWCGRGAERAAWSESAGAAGSARMDLDVALWRCAWMTREDPMGAGAAPRGLAIDGAGSLTAREGFTSIEVWTETELSALHALSWLAVRSGSAALWARMMRAARWHVQHMQPDNATGHPWGLQVFLWLEREAPGSGGREYGATMLSSCQVGLGRPDLFSAYVLLDCARGIEAREGGAARGDHASG